MDDICPPGFGRFGGGKKKRTRTIILPPGSTNPQGANYIEVPPQLQGAHTVVVRPNTPNQEPMMNSSNYYSAVGSTSIMQAQPQQYQSPNNSAFTPLSPTGRPTANTAGAPNSPRLTPGGCSPMNQPAVCISTTGLPAGSRIPVFIPPFQNTENNAVGTGNVAKENKSIRSQTTSSSSSSSSNSSSCSTSDDEDGQSHKKKKHKHSCKKKYCKNKSKEHKRKDKEKGKENARTNNLANQMCPAMQNFGEKNCLSESTPKGFCPSFGLRKPATLLNCPGIYPNCLTTSLVQRLCSSYPLGLCGQRRLPAWLLPFLRVDCQKNALSNVSCCPDHSSGSQNCPASFPECKLPPICTRGSCSDQQPVCPAAMSTQTSSTKCEIKEPKCPASFNLPSKKQPKCPGYFDLKPKCPGSFSSKPNLSSAQQLRCPGLLNLPNMPDCNSPIKCLPVKVDPPCHSVGCPYSQPNKPPSSHVCQYPDCPANFVTMDGAASGLRKAECKNAQKQCPSASVCLPRPCPNLDGSQPNQLVLPTLCKICEINENVANLLRNCRNSSSSLSLSSDDSDTELPRKGIGQSKGKQISKNSTNSAGKLEKLPKCNIAKGQPCQYSQNQQSNKHKPSPKDSKTAVPQNRELLPENSTPCHSCNPSSEKNKHMSSSSGTARS